MRRCFIWVVAAGFGYLVAVYPFSGLAGPPNILIMGEDRDRASIPRNSPIFERIVSAISSHLSDEGFRIKDEKSILKGNFIKRRVSRSTDDSLQIAKEISNPTIDALITISIHPEIGDSGKKSQVNALATGRILNVSTGDHIGNFDIRFPQSITVSQSCVVHRECVLKAIGDRTHVIAELIVVALARQLRSAMNPDRSGQNIAGVGSQESGILKAYRLTFDNLSQSEFSLIETELEKFPGYHSHTVNKNILRHADLTYETRSADVLVKRNLLRLMDILGIDVSVRCLKSTCSITRF